MPIKIILSLLVLFIIVACGEPNVEMQANPGGSGASLKADSAAAQKRIAARLSTVEDDVESLLSQLTLAEKVSLVNAAIKLND